MGGGLMQLVAYGAQDVYLTGNPQITFFKVVYRRHTNFAMESIEQTFNGTGAFGNKVQCPIVRNGDLITKMYLRTTVSAGTSIGASAAYSSIKWAWVKMLGHALISSVELEIGGTRIDKHYGEWLTIWNELSRKIGQDRGYDQMIGNVESLTVLDLQHPAFTMWVPLKFFFCRFDGLALPLIALQYHEVRINFEFLPVEQLLSFEAASGATGKGLATALGLTLSSCSLFVDYIYLDSEERKRFAQASHEYLIEALQFPGSESITGVNSKFRLNLNHPCKFLIWTAKLGRYTNGNTVLAYHPTDTYATQLAATKRWVLKYAAYAVAGFAMTTLYGQISPVAAGTTTDIFNKINPVAIANNGAAGAVADVDNVTILGELLPLDFISQTVASWVTSSTVVVNFPSGSVSWVVPAITATAGDGIATKDIVLYQWDNFGNQLNGAENSTNQALLQLNGQDRFSQREGTYFNYCQPWQHFSNTPQDGVNVYSFALNPEEHQPSGTCNFSRIDNATLSITFGRVSAITGLTESSYLTNYLNSGSSTSNFNVWAVNYNVLRVMSGMAGLAYSN